MNIGKSHYPKEAYERLFSVEDRHFWFIGRNRIIEDVVRRMVPAPRGKRYLEVGCGTGFVLSLFERLGYRCTGIDLHNQPLAFAKKRTHATLLSRDLFEYSPRKNFDAIGAFDVVEHVGDDAGFIQRCKTLLSRNGWLFLTVPSDMRLWSRYDDISGHKRRYDEQSLVSLLTRNGFSVVLIRRFGFFQYVPHILMKKLIFMANAGQLDDSRLTDRFFTVPHPVVNGVLRLSMVLESILHRWIDFPFGTSIIVAARKNS